MDKVICGAYSWLTVYCVYVVFHIPILKKGYRDIGNLLLAARCGNPWTSVRSKMLFVAEIPVRVDS